MKNTSEETVEANEDRGRTIKKQLKKLETRPTDWMSCLVYDSMIEDGLEVFTDGAVIYGMRGDFVEQEAAIERPREGGDE